MANYRSWVWVSNHPPRDESIDILCCAGSVHLNPQHRIVTVSKNVTERQLSWFRDPITQTEIYLFIIIFIFFALGGGEIYPICRVLSHCRGSKKSSDWTGSRLYGRLCAAASHVDPRPLSALLSPNCRT